MNKKQLNIMSSKPGFIAALDQSGGSTPKALKAYGVTEDMYKLIDELNKKESITIIMVSHDIKSSVKYASHILHLNGDNTFFGTADDYIKSPVGKSFFSEDIKNV